MHLSDSLLLIICCTSNDELEALETLFDMEMLRYQFHWERENSYGLWSYRLQVMHWWNVLMVLRFNVLVFLKLVESNVSLQHWQDLQSSLELCFLPPSSIFFFHISSDSIILTDATLLLTESILLAFKWPLHISNSTNYYISNYQWSIWCIISMKLMSLQKLQIWNKIWIHYNIPKIFCSILQHLVDTFSNIQM